MNLHSTSSSFQGFWGGFVTHPGAFTTSPDTRNW